jgi:hypothetical protein
MAHSGATAPQIAAGATQHDLSSVFDSLQRIRRIDPAAEQQLIEQLRKSPAESWPLVAEQFRASLEYREQLKSQRQASHDQVQPASGAWSHQNWSDVGGRPSKPIGLLTDPRSAESHGVSSEAMAHVTPYSAPAAMVAAGAGMPPNESSAPAPFASDGPVYPMAMSNMAGAASPKIELTGDMVQASFNGPTHDTPMGRDWRQLVEMAATDLRRTAPDSPASTAEVHQLATLRILDLLSGNTEQALEAIPHLSSTEQDYWSNQLFALATYLDHHAQPDEKRRAAASVMHLDHAVSSLRELGTLSLRNLSFCKEVYGYGAIEPYEADRFSPGEQISLYVEVENYHSRSTEKGYCTLLGSTYEIRNEAGERVAGGEMPDVDDCCRSRRRDFHIRYGITLPKNLIPGEYRFNLNVKDRQGDKLGSATATFEIIGSGT